MAIALIAATILLAVGFAASNANADVTVYRGNTMEIIDTARTEPVVLRGGGSSLRNAGYAGKRRIICTRQR